MDTCWTNVEKDGIWRLRVDGPCLNGARVERLRDELRKVIATGAKGIIIDLQRVDRLDPLGLAGLALLPKEIEPPVRLALAALRPEVQNAALVVHLHDVVDIYEDARAAVCDLSAPTSNP
jgi:anti-anti-sigma regulatory factor